MRFADLVKDKEIKETKESSRPRVAPAREAEPPVVPVPVVKLPPARPPEPVLPPVDREKVEREIREDLEKQFQERLAGLETEARRMREEQARAQENLLERERKQLQEEQQKIYRLTQDLEKKSGQMEQDRRRWEQEIEKIRQSPPVPVTPKLDAPPPSPVRFQPEVSIQESASKAAVPPPPPPVAPFQPPAAEPLAPLPTEADYEPETEKQVRRVYSELAGLAQSLFDGLSKKEVPDLARFRPKFLELISIIRARDTEILVVALEPYPDFNHFVYHAVNSVLMALVLGTELRLLPEELERLALAALVHDAGLAKIHENLDYPGELTAEIKKAVLDHPQYAADLLKDVIDDKTARVILEHHEACNGKGYPKGLDEKAICLEAKILHVVDAFEAMTHERPYRRKPLDVDRAVKEIIEKGRGIYDRDVMKVLMSRIGLYPVNTLVELSNRQIARVLRQNRQFPISPVVKVEYDEDGNKLASAPVLDLTRNHFIHVVAPVGSLASYAHKHHHHDHQHRVPAKGNKAIIQQALITAAVLGAMALLTWLVLKI